MPKEKVFSARYEKTFLETLKHSLFEHEKICDKKVIFHGLPIEEWAGAGYAIGAIFDPYVLTAQLRPSHIYLDWPEESLEGITSLDRRPSQKEEITFRISENRTSVLYLPMTWGGMYYNRFETTEEWKVLANISELPALAVREGEAVFAFHPLRILHRYLNMADPSTTADLTDLMIKAILGASNIYCDLDEDDLRRDFHSLGVNSMLLGQMHKAVGKPWDVNQYLPELRKAAQLYVAGEKDGTKQILAELFKQFAQKRSELVPVPVYIIVMPHGGILFEHEGYAEYDSPHMAARVLNLFMDWADKYGFRFAPDVGAGTLEEFVKLHPQTIGRLKKAWEEGKAELVNGTYSQPYLQLWHKWDQEKQFEVGLRVMEKIFGRRPEVYASQEIALHPALPEILAEFGYKYAVNRSQNLGSTPIDASPIINWLSPGGTGIRSLPAHPLRSEFHGSQMCRHFPIMQIDKANDNLPFMAFTNLMDQSFVDLYSEEIVRANAYTPVWGEFVTPSEFFRRTSKIKAVNTCYAIDQFDYELDLSGNCFHGHQTGGYSSEHAFVYNESARLQQLEKSGELSEKALKKLLNQQAHDCYIIPYFSTGYFMEDGAPDYNGPRYRCLTDGPRGLERSLRDAVDYPQIYEESAPVQADAAVIEHTTLSMNHHVVHIDPATGKVVGLNKREVSLGMLRYNEVAFEPHSVGKAGNRLKISGHLPGFTDVLLEYFISDSRLYCEASVVGECKKWSDKSICWADCVLFEHKKATEGEVIRNVSEVKEPTTIEKFHSLDYLTLTAPAGENTRLYHGGNIFFRQNAGYVQNRLWCYGEFCKRFWWAVEL